MKIFKKKKKETVRNRRITVFLWHCFKKLQVKEKIKKGNEWADNHKKATATITISLLSTFLLIGVLTSIISIPNDTQENILDGIEDVQPMFQGIQRIQDAKSYQKEQISGLIHKGKKIKRDLDSLLQIKNKTHEDSTLILVNYKQLEIIARNLKNR